MDFICDNCKSKNTYVNEYQKKVLVKDKEVDVSGKRRFCSDCDSLVYDSLLDNTFMRYAFQKYNERYGLPKEEIINIRKKLNLSVSDFAKIIGCAKKTLVSYENGNSIPNDIYLVTIKTIIDNPEVIRNMIESNKMRYSDDEYFKVTTKINKSLSNNYYNFIHKVDSEISEYNGYTSFSFEKAVNLIKMLCKNGIYKTKLNKEMFYVDFFTYKKFCCSLTGLEYSKITYGPVPDDFENILDYLNKNNEIDYDVIYHNNYEEHIIKCNSKINYGVFTDEEQEIIKNVIDKFKDYNVREIVEYSHEEKAFKETSFKDKISYDLALDLRDF